MGNRFFLLSSSSCHFRKGTKDLLGFAGAGSTGVTRAGASFGLRPDASS